MELENKEKFKDQIDFLFPHQWSNPQQIDIEREPHKYTIYMFVYIGRELLHSPMLQVELPPKVVGSKLLIVTKAKLPFTIQLPFLPTHHRFFRLWLPPPSPENEIMSL